MSEIQAGWFASCLESRVSDADLAFGGEPDQLLGEIEPSRTQPGYRGHRRRPPSGVQREVDRRVPPPRRRQDAPSAALDARPDPGTGEDGAHSVVRLLGHPGEEGRQHRIRVDQHAPGPAVEDGEDAARQVTRVDDGERNHDLRGGKEQRLPALLDQPPPEETVRVLPAEAREPSLAHRAGPGALDRRAAHHQPIRGGRQGPRTRRRVLAGLRHGASVPHRRSVGNPPL